jgi:hypothetical protein
MPLVQVGGHQTRTLSNIMFADVDDDDFDKICNYKWAINSQSSKHTMYAHTRTGGNKIHMHRLIMGLGDYRYDKRIINHIDGNGLNNKKSNLEICDAMHNSQSFRKHHNHRCGLVYLDNSMKRIKRWRACITINKVQFAKRFETENEAKQYIDNIINQQTTTASKTS